MNDEQRKAWALRVLFLEGEHASTIDWKAEFKAMFPDVYARLDYGDIVCIVSHPDHIFENNIEHCDICKKCELGRTMGDHCNG